MRDFFKENDVILAEVSFHSEKRGIHLQTKNKIYSKLRNGVLLKINHKLMKQQKKHLLYPSEGIMMVLGVNGMIWIGIKEQSKYQEVKKENRLLISKYS